MLGERRIREQRSDVKPNGVGKPTNPPARNAGNAKADPVESSQLS
jgi:hypothetical protein